MGYKPVEAVGHVGQNVGHVGQNEGHVGQNVGHVGQNEGFVGHCPTVKKSFRLPQEWDDALTAQNINFSELVRKLICAFLEGKIGLDESGEVVAVGHVGQNVGHVGQNVGHVGQLKPIQKDIEVLRDNQEILFNLNKKREEEIEELKRELYQLEAEFKLYLEDIAEKGKDGIEQKMEVEEE